MHFQVPQWGDLRGCDQQLKRAITEIEQTEVLLCKKGHLREIMLTWRYKCTGTQAGRATWM